MVVLSSERKRNLVFLRRYFIYLVYIGVYVEILVLKYWIECEVIEFFELCLVFFELKENRVVFLFFVVSFVWGFVRECVG